MQVPDYRVQIPFPQMQPASFSPFVEQVPSLVPDTYNPFNLQSEQERKI